MSSLQKSFDNEVKNENLWNKNSKIVVGVSGGIDSMVLLNLLMNQNKSLRPQLIVVNVNHDLRGKISQQESNFVRSFCHQHHLTFYNIKWQKSLHPKNGIEAAGRHFRYNFFSKIMKKTNSTAVITAHHKDDQLETILFNIIRTGNLPAISGIKMKQSFKNGFLIRPLLPFSKAELKSYGITHRLIWFEDKSNQDVKYSRNRLRVKVIPQLLKINSAAVDHFLRYALQSIQLNKQIANHINKHLDEIVINQSKQSLTLNLNYFDQLPKELWSLYLKIIIKHWHNSSQFLNDNKIEELIELISNDKKPHGKLDLSQEWEVYKEYNKAIFRRKSVVKTSLTSFKADFKTINLNHWIKNNERSFGVFDQSHLPANTKTSRKHTFYLKNSSLPLNIRLAHENDKVRLANGGHQTVKRILTNAKVNLALRNCVYVLTTKQGIILALLGYKESVLPLNNRGDNKEKIKPITLVIS